MRKNGRQNHELRRISIERNYIKYAEGSVLISFGETKVICTATLEDRVPSFLKNTGRGWITAEYSMLPRSTQERNMRESVRGKLGGRTQEIQRLIGRALRGVLSNEKLGEKTVWVDCDVIQADGGSRTAAITGGFIAVADAFLKLHSNSKTSILPINDYLAAVSVGIINGEICSDLEYEEDSKAEVDMNVVMTGRGKLIEVQATAENKPFTRAKLNEMLKVAADNIEELIAIEKNLFKDLETRFSE
jgi:ribonuclease PH